MNYHEQWKEQGYLIIPKVFDAGRVAQLYELCESAFEQWRNESSEDSEPMGYCYGPSAWTLIHVNHPKYYKQHPEWLRRLLDAIANPLAVQIMRDIFQDEPIFEQSNYYIDPPGATRVGGWHRDCQFFAAGDEEAERRMLFEEADPARELHMHIPLVKTAATEVVPGSHRRWDTLEEHHIRRHDAQSDAMPNALRLELNPGDMAFFHVNALHRGLYYQGVPRRTIAVTCGAASKARPITVERMRDWRGYVCTYQPWFLKPNYLDGVAPTTRESFQRFIDVYGGSWTPEYLVPELGSKLHAYFTEF